MSDTQNTQREIFSKIEGLIAFLDTTEQKKSRENLEQWKDTLEGLRDITNNPLPFLLTLLKQLKDSEAGQKVQAKIKNFKAAKKKNRKGKKDDADFEEPKKSFLEKHNLDKYADPWLATLNTIIRKSVMNVLPRIDDILYEEIIKAFNCDLNSFVPVMGDGIDDIANPSGIVIEVAEIDFLKQLFNDPAGEVGKFMYEQDPLNAGVYPPGQSPYPVNRFLRDMISNGSAGIGGGGAVTIKTIYGKSGRALFDVDILASLGSPTLLRIRPYYKSSAAANAQYQSAPIAGNLPGNGVKFTFIEFLKDYFDNIKLIEMQNLIGALLEILTGFMSVRNKSFSLQDAKALQWFVEFVVGVLEACDGDALIGPNTEAMSHHAELTDEDNYFNFTIEQKRAIDLEVARKQGNVLTLESCNSLDIPIDNSIVDDAVDNILGTAVMDEKLKEFDLLLQRLATSSAKKAGYDLGLGEISLPVEIDFKENLIKKLPQILMMCILNPKGVLPIVLTGKLMNQNGGLCTSIELFAKIFKRVLIRVIKEILQEVMKYIFLLARQYLLRKLRELIKAKLSEQAKKKIRMIKRLLDILLPLIDALNNAKNCQEIYNILLALLLANMPDIPFTVPPFLVAAAKMRSGTSPLNAFEGFLSKMQKAGLPIGDLPDGSPNEVCPMIFNAIEAIDNEMTDNGKVQVSITHGQVITPTGPASIVPFTGADGIVE